MLVLFCAVAAFVYNGRAPVRRDVIAGDGLRIVSLAPNVTEMLFALGVEKHIVGVTSQCDYPAAAKTIERVGLFGPPAIEKLLSLKPDLLISTVLPDSDACQLLSNSGIELLEVKINSIEDMFAALCRIGLAVQRPKRAEKLVRNMRAELNAVAKRYNNTNQQRPKVFIEIWYDPITTAGGSSFIDDVISRAGGQNVAHDIAQSYPHINPEMIIQWDPDVIILCYMSFDGRTSQFADRIGLADISAVRAGRIITDFPNALILRPGPRLVEGVKLLAQRIHQKK